MTKFYIPFYIEWMDFIDNLSDEEYTRLMRAIFDFARGRKKKLPRFKPGAEMAYNFITSAIRRCEEKRGFTESITKCKPEPQKREAKVFKRIDNSGTEITKPTENERKFPTNNKDVSNSKSTTATKKP